MPTLLSIDDICHGAGQLELGDDGVPCDPVAVVDLTSPVEDVESAVHAFATATRVVVGISDGRVPPHRTGLARACALVLAPEEQDVWGVRASDCLAAADAVAQAARRTPRAAATLVPLLRLTAQLPVRDGLLAESLAYSMLLAGPEFAAWRRATPKRNRAPEAGEPVLVTRDGDELSLVLNRAGTRNAYSRELRDALVEALTIAVLDPTTSVRLSGAGPAFCSGGHLDEFGATADVTVAHHVRLARSAGLLLHDLRRRTTVTLHGACVGAGIELPAFAGHVIAGPDVAVRLPELAMGLVPGAGGTVSVTARIGRWRTAWMVLSGEQVDLTTALRWGLVDAAA